MKNDLTRDEWIALSKFLPFLGPVLISKLSPTMDIEIKEKAALAEQAIDKFITTAEAMEGK
ncbi:MAG: hypothetical protein K8V42_05615 [Enterococcus aquimarinus]|uniref:Uncharacterized protein n=1 Tax=Enterococcus aquimarinus TaxID=328396 RepID=A0A9E4DRZ7_9ENTE|nr:hypothetical protein [Enterococcus aquimarinus]